MIVLASSRYLITSTTLSSSAASVTFSSIPSTYTDLVLKVSARCDETGNTESTGAIRFNSDTNTNYSNTRLRGSGSAAASLRNSSETFLRLADAIPGPASTSNTFGNMEIYIPSYTVSQNKPIYAFPVAENNATLAFMSSVAGLWRNTAAISSLLIYMPNAGVNFVSGSTFTLYGLKNS